jgi:hypothetical protein
MRQIWKLESAIDHSPGAAPRNPGSEVGILRAGAERAESDLGAKDGPTPPRIQAPAVRAVNCHLSQSAAADGGSDSNERKKKAPSLRLAGGFPSRDGGLERGRGAPAGSDQQPWFPVFTHREAATLRGNDSQPMIYRSHTTHFPAEAILPAIRILLRD